MEGQERALPDLIWQIDDEGICVEVTPGIGVISAPPEENVGPSKVHDLLPTRTGHMLLGLVRKAIAAGTAQVGELELSVNGRIALCHVQVVPYTHNRTLAVIHDSSELTRTENELGRSQRQLRKLAEHLQTAREEERIRVAREIHDQMGQALTALKIDLACLRVHLHSDPRRAEDDLAGITTSVEAMIEAVQNIATELRPRMLDDFGLTAAVEWQVERFANRTGLACRCSVPDHDLKIDSRAATALFRILQEALTNVFRHANAKNVTVNLQGHQRWAILEILDDGQGVRKSNTGHPFALGVIGMQERARSLGGEVSVTPRVDGGTRVWVRVPLQPQKASESD